MHDLLQLKKHDGESETFRSDLFWSLLYWLHCLSCAQVVAGTPYVIWITLNIDWSVVEVVVSSWRSQYGRSAFRMNKRKTVRNDHQRPFERQLFCQASRSERKGVCVACDSNKYISSKGTQKLMDS
jgi:hypothetical protein